MTRFPKPAELGDVVQIPSGAWFQENNKLCLTKEAMTGCVITPRSMMTGALFNGLIEVYLTTEQGRRIQVFENSIHITYRGEKRGS